MIRVDRNQRPRVLFDEVEAARVRREVEEELARERRFNAAWRRYAKAVRQQRAAEAA